MDRIDHSIKPAASRGPDALASVESALFSTPSGETTCASFAPLHYERGYAYPLIVWLHGQGSDERQLMRVMPLVSMRNYVAVAPRGVRLRDSDGPETRGWQQSDRVIDQAKQRIFDAIDSARRRFHVAEGRVFLAGFGSGGTMAFRVALDHPREFAGVLSFCGAFPDGGAPLGNLVDARRLPILLAVGRRGSGYDSDAVCGDLRLLHTAGFTTMLRQYPCGDELSPQMLTDMDRWIIEQIASEEASAEHAFDLDIDDFE